MTRPLHSITLTGLDGSNPLAFLAALGTFRALDEMGNLSSITMSWTDSGNQWTPVLNLDAECKRDELLDSLEKHLRRMADHRVLTFAQDLRVPADKFRELAKSAIALAVDNDDAIRHSYLAAFGCDAIRTETGEIEDTAVRTMSGAGHQHFLKFMNDLAKKTTAKHLEEALFGPWSYRDPGPSLRFDPLDDRRYALRWKNPSQDASTTVRGANRLAVEGLPLITTVPVGSRLETTGFSGHESNNTFWTWPIWQHPISMDVCRSILALKELTSESPDPDAIHSRGIAAVYRSQRITVGKYRNFTPARTV